MSMKNLVNNKYSRFPYILIFLIFLFCLLLFFYKGNKSGKDKLTILENFTTEDIVKVNFKNRDYSFYNPDKKQVMVVQDGNNIYLLEFLHSMEIHQP